ncbi:MAG TPA: hypothetical protein VFM10_12635 [Terriglobales bacterium]|nr:hypothetical protein [Terriglobales bacterium]
MKLFRDITSRRELRLSRPAEHASEQKPRRSVTLRPGTLRFVLLVAALTTLAAWMFSLSNSALAANSEPQVRLTTSGAGPREIEDQTERAILRDYSKAWQALADARSQNRPDLLGTMFTGFAKDEITQAIEQQKKANTRMRYIDHGHNLQAVFYSQEGSALQLRDTAQLEIQVLDGNSVVHTENATVHYLAIMTPTSDHWQVRMLQAVP